MCPTFTHSIFLTIYNTTAEKVISTQLNAKHISHYDLRLRVGCKTATKLYQIRVSKSDLDLT